MIGRRRVLRGIRDKLLFSFSLLVASIALFVFLFFPARLERQAMSAVADKAEAIRDMTAYSLSAGLFFADPAAVDEVLRGATLRQDVSGISVRDTSGRVITSRGTAIPESVGPAGSTGGAAMPDRATYFTWAPITHTGTRIGDLAVGVSLADVRHEVASARRTGLAVGFVIFLVGFATVYVISAFVTRPLTDVLGTVDQIAAGDISRRAVEPPDVEVARLVRGFNLMVDGLERAQSDLTAANELLESRVEVRTRELLSTSETLQSLIDLAPQAILSLDLDWRVTRWNQAAEKLYGWAAAEVIGKPLPYIPDDRVADAKLKQARVATGETLGPVEVVHARKDGERLTVLLSVGVLRDTMHAVTGFVAVITDLTERKALELQLGQAQKMEATGRLAGGVAHDFNNVLTVITTASTLLEESVLTPDQREEVEQIAAAALRAAGLTRQLLTFSRKQIVKLEPVNLNEIIGEMEKMLRRLLRENIRLSSVLSTDLGLLVADVTQVQQVIMNLAVNASDAMPDGGTLTIETRQVDLCADDVRALVDVTPGRYAMLIVTDTGTGMDSATMSRIFEPFFTTKGPGEGTGLGLATTYAVVSQIGGHIDVQSAPGRGTTFNIFIPMPPPSALPKRTSGSFAAPLVSALGHETVLLVEDESAVRKILRLTLERLGYVVFDAPDGESALTLAAAYDGPIDVVVTDLMMPGMNGRAFADALLLNRKDIRVVFMSGYTDETVDRVGLVDTSHTFIQKPFSGPQLARAIRGLLAGSRAGGD